MLRSVLIFDVPLVVRFASDREQAVVTTCNIVTADSGPPRGAVWYVCRDDKRIGHTSITVHVETWVRSTRADRRSKVTEGHRWRSGPRFLSNSWGPPLGSSASASASWPELGAGSGERRGGGDGDGHGGGTESAVVRELDMALDVVSKLLHANAGMSRQLAISGKLPR